MNTDGTIDTFSRKTKIITCLVDMFYLNYLIQFERVVASFEVGFA